MKHVLTALAAAVTMTSAPVAIAAAVPIADPTRSARLRRTVSVFTLPMAAPDLRRLSGPRDVGAPPASGPLRFRYIGLSQAEPVQVDRPERLLGIDRGAMLMSQRVRRDTMAAGLSFRMSNADGVLASQFGMSGAVGRAVARIVDAAELR